MPQTALCLVFVARSLIIREEYLPKDPARRSVVLEARAALSLARTSKKKATGVNPSPEGAAVLRSFAIADRLRRFGLALGNERVRLIGELGNGEQVDETEALRGDRPNMLR